MADIQYSSTNNSCFAQSLGNIIIDQINFSGVSEQTSFASYSIAWSGDFESLSQISTDGRLVEFLSNGTYAFTINSLVDSSVLGPYTINISSPPELKITDIKYKAFSCDNTDGSAVVYVSGGTPPYVVYGGSTFSDSTSSTDIVLSGIQPTTINLSVIDASGCVYTWPSDIEIKNSTITVQILETVAPTLIDSYGVVRLRIQGYGPFSMSFEKIGSGEVIYVDTFDTEYIVSSSETEYEYRIYDKITPGTYTLTVNNSYGCTYTDTLAVPNIAPMTALCTIANDDGEKLYNTQLALPIFDTIFIPYKQIQENSDLWQLIKKLSLKDIIHIKINNDIRQFRVVRNMLDKYCLDENKIEILRLSNESSEWFFYFYIAPSINLNDNIEYLNYTYKIVDPDTHAEYDLFLGLNSTNTIDSDNATLLRGSFLLNGVDHNQFVNQMSSPFINKKNNAYVSVDNEQPEEYDYVAKNISKTVLKNIYAAGFVTSINFLEQFNTLNIYVNINDSACNMTMEEYQYSLNIKNLLKGINNFNNFTSIYIYNLDNISKIGQLTVFISGNTSFTTEGAVSIDNEYNITYYTFDDESPKLKMFYQNNEPIRSNTLKNISNEYVIIRIKDIYNNIPRIVRYNNLTINYDEHFTISKNIIQKYNKNVTEYFQYGDILLYVGSKANPDPPIDSPAIPKAPASTTPNPTNINDTTDIVYQTPDQSNTASLTVNLIKTIRCTIRGPKNYRYLITSNVTEFKNMIPGVYTIIGDAQDLYINNLYQQEYRLLIERNTSNTIDIDFVSYSDQTFIRDI